MPPVPKKTNDEKLSPQEIKDSVINRSNITIEHHYHQYGEERTEETVRTIPDDNRMEEKARTVTDDNGAVEIGNYWKLVIGITLGVCMLIFGAVFWDSATDEYYNKLNGETYEIESCIQYMEPPLGSISDRDDCVQKRQIGGIFLGLGTLTLWATLYFNKEKINILFKKYLSNDLK